MSTLPLNLESFGTKVRIPKCVTNLKLPSILYVHLQNQFCIYVEKTLLEPNFVL